MNTFRERTLAPSWMYRLSLLKAPYPGRVQGHSQVAGDAFRQPGMRAAAENTHLVGVNLCLLVHILLLRNCSSMFPNGHWALRTKFFAIRYRS